MHSPSASIVVFAILPHLAASLSSLYVQNAPNHIRPYVIEHYASAQAISIGQQIYRFPVTGPSSGGAFSLLSTSSPSSNELGVLPHHHQTHHENFFCLKGRFQLWAEDEARLLTVGDYGSVPRNTTHTFQILDPDTEMVGSISPGGFEKLFFFLADANYTSSTHSPYVPAPSGNGSSGSPPAAVITALESFDVYAELNFTARRDLVDGSAPSGGWHSTPNILPEVNGTPYFVAKDYGPKFLNCEFGYQIVQPFVTDVTGGGDFTQGSITMSRRSSNTTTPTYTLLGHTAFEVLEGALSLTIEEETVTLIMGDVAFIPGNTSFSYWSDVVFTKVMYVSAGVNGLDQKLLKKAESWGWPVFPAV
ncbi:putative quercetin 2,3-dioxygenase [Melanomma pulvis-pyrius CBS 109.77]|uniref:Putative quercetin 2,3-dioxygenase n=1 Tax=Melanomma pulvis-pyrius CBS 109.77 TaxID=1314802 RepID=A0A6A6WTC2_9PLEO|nr:putative quercetin 2,3-dioxygenase [Melanomma pulvis-pyrius CBS 109.77]